MRGREPTSWVRWATAAVAVVALSAAVAAPAAACPVCDTGTGDAVRAGIREDLAVNVAATVLPFAAVGGVILAVHFGFPPAGEGRRSDDRRTRG